MAAKSVGILKFAKEAIIEELFTKTLGGLWGTATGLLGGVTKERFEAVLSHKGMKDNALAMENLGSGMRDEISDDELRYLREALVRAKKECKLFLRNIILVIGWPLPAEEVEEKKEDESKKISGFTKKVKSEKDKKKRPKWPPRIRALCQGAKSADEVYERMEAFGLLDEAPDGALDEFFLKIRKEAPKTWASTKKSVESGFESIKTGLVVMKSKNKALGKKYTPWAIGIAGALIILSIALLLVVNSL